ncbi:hypothetical protein MBLNU230_g6663t1 [Neophaeotheca triangularis]
MLQQGRGDGWLSLPIDALPPWASLNGAKLDLVKPGTIPGRGSGLVARQLLNASNIQSPLLTVPRELILGLERIQEHAKVDRDFREVLESLSDFGRRNLMGHQTPRGAILAFLLLQVSTACPDLPQKVGVHSPFTDYIKTLPSENLPTTWTPTELELLIGTTLAPATRAKLKSLQREYDFLCESAANTRWYRSVSEQLNFEDWLQVDAMYRSRALEYPGIGHCMVPCVDVANHASHEATSAIYEKDDSGNAVLLLRDGKVLQEGEEVTITYGDEKGACEMLFSYGFLESGMPSAETLFLDLNIPASDTQRAAKMQIADAAPGFKIIDAGDGEIDWTGSFVWLLCLTADDDLRFEIARTIDGEGVEEENMTGFFKSHELTAGEHGGAARLQQLLSQDELWPVYRLRAVAILQQRVFEQLQTLVGTQEEFDEFRPSSENDVRETVYDQVKELRRLEQELLERAYGFFEEEKLQLVEHPVVQRYLAEMSGGQTEVSDDGDNNRPTDRSGQEVEDFS